MVRDKSSRLFNRAKQSIPGGVNSPVRAFKSVGGVPPFITRASGCHIWDADGNKYIDYIGSWGPMIAGHAHPEVIQAITKTAQSGTSFGAPTELEIQLAEEVIRRIPTIESVRFVNSGTEAGMSAIRLARAFTNRSKIIKFAGCYHGHYDAFLVAAGSGSATFGLPDSLGVTTGSSHDTLIARFNDLESVEDLFLNSDEPIAAIIVEPVSGNMGVIPPDPIFLPGLRELCDKHDALLIFDEVMTGFRVSMGGAQQLYNIRPDITMLGKIIGGGLPVGAFGGRRDIMEMLAPEGSVYQAGTLSGNPLAMSAGLATLQLLDDSAYARLEKTSTRLARGIRDSFAKTNIPVQVQQVGSMLTLFFADKPVTNFEDAKNADHDRFNKFFHAMFEQGVLLPPSGYESWFMSLAHDDDAVETTIAAIQTTLLKI